jgi:glycosyltransferase involved in cell wall biosynthesis
VKILAIHHIDDTNPDVESAIDIWRIWRPLEELKKHVDWQIDSQPTVVKDIEKYGTPEDFQQRGIEDAGRYLGQYDIVFTSYFPDPNSFALLHAVNKRFGTKFIIDQDDDLYNVDPENPFWIAAGYDGALNLQKMAQLAPYLCTTTEPLAKKLSEHSKVNAKVFTIPNYIADSYKHDPIDNGDKIVIGYFGGASHYHDLHETGMLPALEKIMHKYKNVYFVSVGQPIDHYLPSMRRSTIEPQKGRKWINNLFPSLNFDIALGCLRDTTFAQSKSNIKWQESIRMGAAFVASNVGPYKSLKDGVALKVENDFDGWFNALEKVVTDVELRNTMVKNARKELLNWRLEDHWPEYQKMFETVHNNKEI